MARVPPDLIERVREAADIVDLVSKYVDLKKRGQNYFGLCPFHNEKTPSFSVAPAKEIYHCFGCGAGGSAFDFIMEYEKIGFIEAIQWLGEQYGIDVKLSQEERGNELFPNLYELHKEAMNLYHENLFSKNGEQALSYLNKRGFKKNILKQFKIGLARDSWNILLTHAKKMKYSNEVLEKSGLFIKSEKGTFDRFRNRIMFPIFNASGKVIAFGGRALDSEDPAKYLNSPETVLYRKRDNFYGLHASRQHIREKENVIIVEGYMDFLQLYQAGIQNVIALSGTALTENHAIKIRKFTKHVFLAYDGDSAGIDASIRAGYILLKLGIDPEIISVPNKMDPDDWVKRSGPDEFNNALGNAIPALKFHIRTKKAHSLPAIEKSDFVGEVLSQIGSINDGIIRNELLKFLAQDMGIDEEDLLKKLKTQKSKSFQNPGLDIPEKVGINQMKSKIQRAQIELIKILAGENLEVRQEVREKIQLDFFHEPILKELAKLIIPLYDEIDYPNVINKFDSKDERKMVTEILMSDLDLSNVSSLISDCILTLKVYPIKEGIKDARIRIRELEEKGEDPSEAIIEVTQLQQELKLLSI